MENIKVAAEKGKPQGARTGALLVGIFEKTKKIPGDLKGLDKASGGALKRLIESGDFKGNRGKCVWVYPSKASFKRLLVVGLGEKKKFSAEMFRRAMGTAARAVRNVESSDVTITLPEKSGKYFPEPDALARAAVEGFIMGAYRFTTYKSKPDKSVIKKLVVRAAVSDKGLSAISRAAKRGSVVAESVALARDLANTPGNDLPPEGLAKTARSLARKWGLKCKVFGVPELTKLKMNAILAVGGGSSRPPRLITLEYKPKGDAGKKPPLVFVGKGITFDSGGISIKPSANMHQMKYDMSGAAAVLGLVIVAARCKWKRPVVSIMVCAENLPGSKAYRPGDVVKTASGIKVEVQNTDAEGRMVLSDALHYAGKFKPAAVVDVATLTGACEIALGKEAIGLMSRDEKLAGKILDAGVASGERAWELPLWEEYDPQISSDVADIKNVGGRAAGTITAGVFLARFAEDYRWAHLDIAGTAWSDSNKGYKIKGATGAAVRILAELGEIF